MSGTTFDDAMAARLDVLYARRDMLRRRALVHELLDARPGEDVVDVGCGPGFYVVEIASPLLGKALNEKGGTAWVRSAALVTNLAAHLKRRLPSATHLELAFRGLGGISRGTATTALEGAHKGGAVRRDAVGGPGRGRSTSPGGDDRPET